MNKQGGNQKNKQSEGSRQQSGRPDTNRGTNSGSRQNSGRSDKQSEKSQQSKNIGNRNDADVKEDAE